MSQTEQEESIAGRLRAEVARRAQSEELSLAELSKSLGDHARYLIGLYHGEEYYNDPTQELIRPTIELIYGFLDKIIAPDDLTPLVFKPIPSQRLVEEDMVSDATRGNIAKRTKSRKGLDDTEFESVNVSKHTGHHERSRQSNRFHP